MEQGYSEATGDHSMKAFIDFHVGLSPPDRETKRKLDRAFQELVGLYKADKGEVVLPQTASLALQYQNIHDNWQLYNLHWLRAACLYAGKANFDKAEIEYRECWRWESNCTQR